MTEGEDATGSGSWVEPDDAEGIQWYRTLAETVDGGVYQLNADGRFIAVDDVMVEITGYARDALLGANASLVFDDAGLAHLGDERRDRTEPGSADVLERELSIRSKTGETISCDGRLKPLTVDDGDTRTIGIVRPIDEPSPRERPPVQSDGSIASVLDSAEVGVFLLDDEFEVAWINDTVERYFGLASEDVIGRDKREMIDETMRDRVADPETFADTVLSTYEDNGYVERFECRVTPGDGREERWLEHRSKPIESGEYAGGRIELYYDVTEQHQRVLQLRRLNEALYEWLEGTSREAVAERASHHLREILDLEINGVFLYDPAERRLEPTAWSDPAETLFDDLPTFEEGEGIAWRVFETGETAVYGDVTSDDAVYNPDTPARSEIVLPVGDHGVVIVGSERRNAFDDGDLMLAKVAVSSLEVTFERIQHERSLEREYAQTEKLLQTAPIAIAVEDTDGETVLANQRAQATLGMTERKLVEEPGLVDERNVYDADGEPLDPEETPTARVRATGEAVFDQELVVERPSGERTWFSVNAAPLFGSDGILERVIIAAEDITERKEHERQLERRKSELETELSEILGRVSDGFYALDDEWRFTHLNERAEAMLGHSSDELHGEPIWDVFSGATGSAFDEQFHEAMDSQEPRSFEQYAESLGIWTQVQVYPSETGLSVYFRDVTERKERERALEESEQRYRALAENFPNGVVALYDEALRYTLADGTAFDDLPLSAADLEGRTPTDVFPAPVGEELESMFRSTFDGEKTTSEIAYDGHVWDVHTTPVEDENDDVFTGLVIAQDVTDRKEYQRQLEASNERLEQFAYSASHDLQEPLRMVTSYLKLIESRYADDLDDDGEEFIDYAVDGADRMREMIDGLLEYSRVETQGDPFEPVDLEGVFEDVRTDLQIRIEERDAEITKPALPRVRGDEGQLRQVFQNLVSNAIEYSGDEPPRIEITAERNGSTWLLSVRDEGIGIDSEDADRIFDVFERLHGPEKHDGTGIGLALCRRIVERHGGEIWVDSEPGEGSTFSFTFPAVDDGEDGA